MAIDQKTMLQAIYDAMFDALTTTPGGIGGGRPILPRATSYMSLSIPGNPIDPTQFANAWSPTNPNGSMAAAENFSTFVDPIPMLSPVYVPGASTDEMYGEIVHANVSPPPPDPVGQAAFDKADALLHVDGIDFDEEGKQVTVKVDSPFYRNYQNKKKAYDDALTGYLTNFLQYDLSNNDDQRKWAILAPVLRGSVDMAWNNLQAARPGVIETALATVGQHQQSSRAGLFARARQTYEATRKGSLADPALFWHACEPFPANWFAPSAADNFTSLTIESRRLRISEDSRFRSFGGGGGVNFGLWRVGGGASHQTQQTDMSKDTSELRVSFRFGRVEIRNRWLNQALLSLNGWSVAGRGPGGYSNGTATTNNGVFPLLRTSFIVASDITISGKWGHSDQSIASKATSASASVGWGPFSASGSYSNSSSSKKFNSSFDGTTLRVPGMQEIGWLSSIVPFSAPKDGPPARLAAAQATRRRSRGAYYNPYAVQYAQPEEQPVEPVQAIAGSLEDGSGTEDVSGVPTATGTNGSGFDDGSRVEEAAAAIEASVGTLPMSQSVLAENHRGAHETDIASVFVSAES